LSGYLEQNYLLLVFVNTLVMRGFSGTKWILFFVITFFSNFHLLLANKHVMKTHLSTQCRSFNFFGAYLLCGIEESQTDREIQNKIISYIKLFLNTWSYADKKNCYTHSWTLSVISLNFSCFIFTFFFFTFLVCQFLWKMFSDTLISVINSLISPCFSNEFCFTCFETIL
jgi:hypothetical protein